MTLGGLSLVADPDDDGVTWRCPHATIDGWWSSPAPVMETQQRPRTHGVWVGESWLPGRSISLRGWCEVSDWDASDARARVQAALDRLHAAASLTDTPLTIADSGRELGATVRRSGEVGVRWVNHRLAQWTVQLLAADPRKLGGVLSASTGLPSTAGGLTVPFTVPFAIEAQVQSGLVSLTNPGTIDGPVTLRIDGPVTAPRVTHVNSGRALVFAASLDLSAGEYLIVDMQRREVLAQGEASRMTYVTDRGWSTFEPGANEWAFAAGGSGLGTLTVTARPAWM
ncbi:MAG: phage tail family protein [Propionicimonas sp.]